MTKDALTRASIIQILRERLSLSAKESSQILEGILDTMVKTLASGKSINLEGLFKMKVEQTPSRPGRNPKTGSYVPIKSRKRISVSISKALRDKILANAPAEDLNEDSF
ncbi:MAG: HU family DNA-binding protein [Deltaproteobacteria bacterium]|nr:HU family DNA-binding protein [Deltaproteobacteria bacterium]